MNDAAPGVMANPPVITLDVNPGVTSIAGARLVPASDPALRYVGKMGATSSIGNVAFLRNRAVTYSYGAVGNVAYLEFVTDAPAFELLFQITGVHGSHRILVDGNYASLDTLSFPSGGAAVHRTRVDFGGVRARRLIRVETGDQRFGGVEIGQGDTIAAPPDRDPVRAVYFGDSYTEALASVAVDGAYMNYAAEASRQMGWLDHYQSGVGGTGYLKASGSGVPFRQRAATDLFGLGITPDVVVIAGGINDSGYSGAQIEAEARAFFDEIAAKLPETIVFVLGPWRPKPTTNTIRDAIRSAAANRQNFYFIDNFAETWQTGSGTVTAPKGDGNGDLYVAADGGHPTIAGHAYLAGRLVADMKKVIAGF